MQVENSFDHLTEDAARCELSYLTIRQLLYIFAQTDAFDVVSDEEDLFGAVY